MVIDGCKLTYFPLAGRGEATRLALTIGSVDFIDERIPFSDWKEFKPTTPWASMPLLTLSDGTILAQQRSILRFVGKETGLYPTGSVLAAKVDELLDAIEDIIEKIMSTDESDRKAALEVGGLIHGMISKADVFIKNNGSGGHTVGDKMTIADISTYCMFSNIISGLFEGAPANSLDGFAHIQACRKLVRKDPAVAKYYSESKVEMPAAFGPLD